MASSDWRWRGRLVFKDTDSPAKVKGIGGIMNGHDWSEARLGGAAVRDAVGQRLNRRRAVLVRAGILASAAALVAAALVAVAQFPPTPDSWYPKCASYRLTGTHCPGCGLTRAVYSLVHGDAEQALAYNPLMVLISPYLLFAMARGLWFWLWGTTSERTLFPPRLMWAFFGVLLAYWLLRNLPWYPFTLLAPHEIGGL